jgi:hypothetical protein
MKLSIIKPGPYFDVKYNMAGPGVNVKNKLYNTRIPIPGPYNYIQGNEIEIFVVR